jgi:hypothetical protein
MQERILRLNIAGSPVEWLSWEEAATLQARGMVAWSLGSPCMTVRGGVSRLTGRQSTLVLNSIMACGGRVFSLSNRTPNLTNSSLFRRDQHLCLYCGKHSDHELTRDHLVPISRGGTDSWMNVVTACRRCNQYKGNKMLEEISMELLALPYTPNHAEYLVLINSHRIRSDQMDFLRPNFSKQSRLR